MEMDVVKWMDSRFWWIECEVGEKERSQWLLQVFKLGTWKNEVATAEMGKAEGKTGYEGQIRKPVSVLYNVRCRLNIQIWILKDIWIYQFGAWVTNLG